MGSPLTLEWLGEYACEGKNSTFVSKGCDRGNRLAFQKTREESIRPLKGLIHEPLHPLFPHLQDSLPQRLGLLQEALNSPPQEWFPSPNSHHTTVDHYSWFLHNSFVAKNTGPSTSMFIELLIWVYCVSQTRILDPGDQRVGQVPWSLSIIVFFPMIGRYQLWPPSSLHIPLGQHSTTTQAWAWGWADQTSLARSASPGYGRVLSLRTGHLCLCKAWGRHYGVSSMPPKNTFYFRQMERQKLD